MKRNLLATTAAAALLASGGIWAQAQAPGPKQDEHAQVHEQKGASVEQRNRADEKQVNRDRTGQVKGTQQAQDRQKKRNAHDPMSEKGDTSRAAEQAPSKAPSAAAENQK